MRPFGTVPKSVDGVPERKKAVEKSVEILEKNIPRVNLDSLCNSHLLLFP